MSQIDNPLAFAGRKVYENSGCQACHTRYLRKNPVELIRYAPDDYFKFHVQASNTVSSRIDVTGLRIGPDVEYTPWITVDPDYFIRYIRNPGKWNKSSIMPSYGYLFREKLRSDEILTASGKRKNKWGYQAYTRGDALMYYLKYSTFNFYGSN